MLAVEHFGLYPPIDTVEHARQRRQQFTVRSSIYSEGETGHEARYRKPHSLVSRYQRAESAFLAAVDDPIPAMQRSGEEEPACHHLEDLIAPSLRLFDREPAVWLGGKQRWIGLNLVEETSDVAIGHHPITIKEQRRHRAHAVGKREYTMGSVIDVAQRGWVATEAV
jgi:hypothetical protein